MVDLDTILSQLIQALQDFSMLIREHSLMVFLGLPALALVIVLLPSSWKRHKERQQRYNPACTKFDFEPDKVGYPSGRK